MRDLKKILVICTIFFVTSILAGCSSPREPEVSTTEAPTATPSPTATPAPISFESAAEANRAELRTFSDYGGVFSAIQEETSPAETPEASSATRCAASFRNLTESDILRVDGEYIYALSDKDLTIFRLSGEAGELISTTPVGTAWSSSGNDSGIFTGSERTPLALFLRGSRLAVLLDVYGYESTGSEIRYSEYVGVNFYDVSDPHAPILLSSTGQGGVYSDAWMSGNALCVATVFSVVDAADAADTDRFVPRVHTAADSRLLDAGSLYALPSGADGCMVLSAYSMDEAVQKNAVAIYGAEANKLYALPGCLFLTDTRAVSAESRRMSDDTGSYTEYAELLCTDLFRFDYDASGIRPGASGIVSGVLPEGSAIAPFSSGYVCISEMCGSYLHMYEGKGGPVPASERSGGVVYTLNPSLTVTAALSELPDGGSIVWAGFMPEDVLLSGENSSYIADLSVPGTITAASGGDAILTDVLLPWKDGGFAGFRHESAGQMTLALYDSSRKKTSERTFGSDYSSTLESLQSYIVLPEKNLLGFAADDSYCLYAENNGEIVFCMSVFLTDWAWNARAFEQNGYLCIADRREVTVYLPDTLENAASFLF